jgi:Family of unknown function (DUF6235)
MAEFYEPTGIPDFRFRLGAGLDLLEQWAEPAGQVAKNAMYKALFAILDGSVFHSYDIVDDCAQPNEFTVMVKEDLVVRVSLHDTGMFGISFIGRVGSAAP